MTIAQTSNNQDWDFLFDWKTATVDELENILTMYNPSTYGENRYTATTPLFDSLHHNRFDLMETLLNAGANPNIETEKTPITIAIMENKHNKYAEKLLEFKAITNKKDKHGDNILDKAIRYYCTGANLIETEDRQLTMVKIKLLIKHGVKISENTINFIDFYTKQFEPDNSISKHSKEIELLIENQIPEKLKEKDIKNRTQKRQQFRKHIKSHHRF